MIRILLPLAVIAALLFAPMLGSEPTEIGGIEKANAVAGWDYVGDTINCWMSGKFSIAGDCAPDGGSLGLAVFAAIFVSAVAAALGVIGLIPVVGKLTSAVTTVAGVIVVAAVGFYVLAQIGDEDGMRAVQWGSYLAGGGGLLTLISGLSGMRGR